MGKKSDLPPKVKELLREIASVELQTQVYRVPIMNLRLEKPLTIAGVTLATIDETLLQGA